MTRSRPTRRTLSHAVLAVTLVWGTFLGSPFTGSAADVEASASDESCAPQLAVGGADPDGLVPIQSLAQGNVFDHGPPRSLLLVTSRPDPITRVVRPDAAEAIAGVDLGSNVLVGLFIGRWPQDGHRVTIESVRVTDAGVCLTAEVVPPENGQDGADSETAPYHVVALPRDVLPLTPGTPWTVVAPDGATIASTKSP